MRACSTYRGSCFRLKELDLRGCRALTREAGRHYHRTLDKLHPSLTLLCGLDLPRVVTKATEVLDLTGISLGISEVELISLRCLCRQPAAPGWGGQRLEGVKVVCLRDTGLDTHGLEVVCAALAGVAIESLDVSNNPIYRDGAKRVALLAQATQSLRIIRMANCHAQWAPEMVQEEARRKAAGKKKAATKKPKSGTPAKTPGSRFALACKGDPGRRK